MLFRSQSAKAAVSSAPNRLDSRLALIRSLLAARDFDRAAQELQPLLLQHPDNAALHVQNGVLAASRNNAVAARSHFDKALQIDPASLEALSGHLALDLNAKNFSAAKARISRRVEAGPVTAGLLLLAARTYGSAGDLTAAEQMLKRAINIDPTSLSAYGMLGQIYLAQKKLDEARAEFDQVASRQTNPVAALTMAGMILQSQGNLSEARVRFERAVVADPRAAVAANNLAWLHAESGTKLDEALQLAQRAAEVMPDSPEVLDTLGWVFFRNDLPAQAVGPLERCVANAPGHGECRYHLGLVYAKTGDKARSREAFVRALALEPGARWAADARRALAAVDAVR